MMFNKILKMKTAPSCPLVPLAMWASECSQCRCMDGVAGPGPGSWWWLGMMQCSSSSRRSQLIRPSWCPDLSVHVLQHTHVSGVWRGSKWQVYKTWRRPPLFQYRPPPTSIEYCPSYIPQGFTVAVATDCIHQIKPERSLLVWFNPTNKKNQKELEDQVFLWIKHQDDCVLFISRIVRWGHCSSDRRPILQFILCRRKGEKDCDVWYQWWKGQFFSSGVILRFCWAAEQ